MQNPITELEILCSCSITFFKNDDVAVADNRHLIVLLLIKNHFLNDLIVEVMPFLSAAGILQHSVDYHTWILYKKVYFEPPQEPQVLAIDDLSFGFVLWLGSCGISFAAFIFELIHPTLFRLMRKLIGLVIFLMLLFVRERHRVGS